MCCQLHPMAYPRLFVSVIIRALNSLVQPSFTRPPGLVAVWPPTYTPSKAPCSPRGQKTLPGLPSGFTTSGKMRLSRSRALSQRGAEMQRLQNRVALLEGCLGPAEWSLENSAAQDWTELDAYSLNTPPVAQVSGWHLPAHEQHGLLVTKLLKSPAMWWFGLGPDSGSTWEQPKLPGLMESIPRFPAGFACTPRLQIPDERWQKTGTGRDPSRAASPYPGASGEASPASASPPNFDLGRLQGGSPVQPRVQDLPHAVAHCLDAGFSVC